MADQSIPLNEEFTNRLAPTVSSGGGNATLTAAQFVGGLYEIGGGTTATITTPTAAAVLAAFPNLQVGDCFDFCLVNGGSGTATMAGGTGVTPAAPGTVSTATMVVFRCVVTGVASPAISISKGG